MSSQQTIATVFGGTGFLGRQVVRLLAKKGVTVKVASRIPERAYFLKPCGVVGQIVPVACDYSDEESIAAAVKGSDIVINCVGILFEKGKRRTFKRAHVDVPAAVAMGCGRYHVKKFVHASALGIEKSTSKYAATKRAGEEKIREIFPRTVIMRPSVMFGEDDNFFNMFARLAQILPFLPLIGGGLTKFQPVYVGDVAQAIMVAIEHGDADGRTFELGGPEILSMKDIYARLFKYTRRPRRLINLSFGCAKFKAAFMKPLPNPPLTADQVESLKTDSVVSPGALTLADLGVHPTTMDLILPSYLGLYTPGGRFAENKAA